MWFSHPSNPSAGFHQKFNKFPRKLANGAASTPDTTAVFLWPAITPMLHGPRNFFFAVCNECYWGKESREFLIGIWALVSRSRMQSWLRFQDGCWLNEFFPCPVTIPLANIIPYTGTTSAWTCVSTKPTWFQLLFFNLNEDKEAWHGKSQFCCDLRHENPLSSPCLPPAISTRNWANLFSVSHPHSERKYSFKAYNYYTWHS